jgi:tripartite-type tricarboxylate transporter receptor subunit TctC
VTASLPVNSIGELIALARSRPGQFNFGSSGSGGSSHLAGELLKKMAGIELTHVPYKGVAPALTDVIAGQVQMIFSSAPAALPQLKAGRIKAIAVTSAKRSAALPDVPTIADSGVPGYDATNWYGVLAPAALSKPLVERLNAEILKALRAADVIDGITRQGADPIGSTPGAFAAYLRSEITKWIKIVRDAGLRSD